MAVVVFGSANVDLSVDVAVLPKRGETVAGSDCRISLGGKGLNQAIAAHNLYRGPVRFIGALGRDYFGEIICSELIRLGLSTDFIRYDSTRPTGTALIHVDQEAHNSITVSGGANLSWTEAFLSEAFFEGVGVGLCQLETPASVTYEVLRRMKSHAAVTILDPAPMPEQSIEYLFPVVDILTPNQTEAEKLLGFELKGVDDAIEGAAELCTQKMLKAVVITLGENGLAYSEGGAPGKWVAPVAVSAVNTVAAGDCFNGALAAAIAEGSSFIEAIQFASTAAALSVAKPGASESMPCRESVDKMMAQARFR